MKNNAIAALVAAIGILACAAQAQDQSAQMVDPNRLVLVVNGEEIKGGEYYRRMEYLPDVGVQSNKMVSGSSEFAFTELTPAYLTIEQLINERTTFELAKAKGIFPTNDEVDGEIKVRQGDNPKLLEEWARSGGTSDELKYLIRVQLSLFKLQTLGITVTDADATSFFADHPNLFVVPKQYTLRMIAVASSDDTTAVDNDLAAHKDFASVAKARSVDVSKSKGGEYGTLSENNLSATLQDALSDTKVGETTKWLTTSSGGGNGAYLKFYLEAIVPAKQLPLDDTLRRQIRRKLMADRGNVKNPDVQKELVAQRAKATIEIKPPEAALGVNMVDPNRTVLVVDGDPIKGAEYYRRMEYLQGVGTRVGNSFSELPPGFLTIRQLINDRLTLQVAKDTGVFPTTDEVDAALKISEQEDPKMLEQWQSAGRSIDELKQSLQLQLAKFNIQTFGITITDAEVENQYKAHQDLYTIPKQYKLRVITVMNPADEQAVDLDLGSGKDFATVAKDRSVDVSKAIGGECGEIAEYKLSPELRDQLRGTRIGEMTKSWIRTAPTAGSWVIGAGGQDNGDPTAVVMAKYLLEDVIPSRKQELDAGLRRKIRRELMLQRGIDKNGNIQKQVDLLLAKAKIDIKQPEFADSYKNYLDRFLKRKGTD